MDARSPDDRRTAFPALDTVEALEAIYGVPNDASTEKVAHWITPPYRTLIEKSPFAALATVGPEGSTVRRAATCRALFVCMTTPRC